MSCGMVENLSDGVTITFLYDFTDKFRLMIYA